MPSTSNTGRSAVEADWEFVATLQIGYNRRWQNNITTLHHWQILVGPYAEHMVETKFFHLIHECFCLIVVRKLCGMG